MEAKRARDLLSSLSLDDEGAFYGAGNSLSLGAGLVYRDVVFPMFDQEAGRFRAQAGLVCILSHECDLDPGNDRFLNGMVLICPILPIQAIVDAAGQADFADDDLGAFLGNVARRRATRCVYFPPIAKDLPDGGLLNLNLIASTDRTAFLVENRVAALTAHAYQTVLVALEQHLMRPKAELLPLTDAPVAKGRTIIV